MKWLVPGVLAAAVWLSIPRVGGATGSYEDIPIGALPADAIKSALQKSLSPQGRFVILIANGTVRVFDTPGNIAQARKALVALENGPALVSFAFIIKTGMHKVTKVTSSGAGPSIPVPATYSPPQVVSNGRGYVVIPSMPTSYVNESLGVQETITQTSVEGGVPRQFAGSTVFPRPVAMTVCPKAPDPAGLHDWAVACGAVPKDEPAWTAARTEILVTPQYADNGMELTLQPQVVVPAADGSLRVIPLRVCRASTIVKQGAPVALDGFPGADPDFYRLFLGAAESTADAISSVTIGAAFDYSALEQQPAQGQPPARAAEANVK